MRAVRAFGAALSAQTDPGQHPSRRLAAMARAYLLFAAEQRPMFTVLFGIDLDKAKYPELRQAWLEVDEMIESAAREICSGDMVAAEALENAVEAAVRGYAALLADGAYGDGPQAVRRAADGAQAAALALIAGRAAL